MTRANRAPDSGGGAQGDASEHRRLTDEVASGRAALVAVPLTRGSGPGAIGDVRIESSIKLIESALEKGVMVGDLAARLGLSRSRFEHLLKAWTGTTFRRHVQAARLAKAKVLLQDQRLRVEEVAWRCGYAHTSSLDREFQRELGLSPSVYRRSNSG